MRITFAGFVVSLLAGTGLTAAAGLDGGLLLMSFGGVMTGRGPDRTTVAARGLDGDALLIGFGWVIVGREPDRTTVAARGLDAWSFSSLAFLPDTFLASSVTETVTSSWTDSKNPVSGSVILSCSELNSPSMLFTPLLSSFLIVARKLFFEPAGFPSLGWDAEGVDRLDWGFLEDG